MNLVEGSAIPLGDNAVAEFMRIERQFVTDAPKAPTAALWRALAQAYRCGVAHERARLARGTIGGSP